MIALLAPWGLAAVFLSAVMAVAWAVQRATGQGGWADVFWSFGLCAAGAGAALYPVDGSPDARQWLAARLTALWAGGRPCGPCGSELRDRAFKLGMVRSATSGPQARLRARRCPFA